MKGQEVIGSVFAVCVITAHLVQSRTSVSQTYNYTTYDSEKFSEESRLVAFLQERYQRAGKVARPVRNSTQNLRIEFALVLIQILDFDETNQVLTTNVWKRYKWIDDHLTWRPEDFGAIDTIRLPSETVWTPDIVLYNNADIQEKKHEELVTVYFWGLVRWIPPAIYKSSCQIDMKNFPFDEQTCHFKFGSWTYDGNKLDLTFYESLVDLDTREYIQSSEWMILSTRAQHNIRYYPCCQDEPYPDLTFYLTIKRRTAFYIYVLILPSVLLSCLTLVLFWIPPQRPDRTSLGMSLFSSFFVLLLILVQSSPPSSVSISLLGMSLFSSFFVLLLILVQSSPPSSDSISLLGVYYCINMVLIAFSTMLSAVVINMTYYLQRKRVPPILKCIFINGLSKILCAQVDQLASAREPPEPPPPDGIPMIEQNNGGTFAHSTGHFERAYKQNQSQIQQMEWRIIASVIDRIFFLLYVAAITLSLVFVFPR